MYVESPADAEIYIDGIGWIPYEFTAAYAHIDNEPDPTEPAVTTTTTQSDQTTTTTDTSVSKTTGNSSITSSHSTTTATGTSVTVTSDVKGGNNNGKGIHIPKFIKDIFIMILFIAAFIMLMRGRRSIILKLRDKHFKTGDARTRIRYMYSYAEKLLAEINLRSEYGNYKQFASEVERWHGDIYFEKGGFENVTDIALRAAFNNEVPSEEELKKCEKILTDLADSIYKKADRIQKCKLMYLNVLVKGE